MEKVDRVAMMVKIRIKDKPGDNSKVAPVEPQASNFNLANHDPSVNAGRIWGTVYEGTYGVTSERYCEE